MRKITLVIIVLGFLTNFVNAQNWDSVGCNGFWNACGGYTYSTTCLMVYRGELYAAGDISGPWYLSANDIVRWNSTSWDSVQNGIPACLGPEAMTVYNGKLIVGGNDINYAGKKTVRNIVSWNDTTWAALGNGISQLGNIAALAVFNGNLYAAGNFDTAGYLPVNNIAMWNGTIWLPVNGGISGSLGDGLALCVYNNKLYVGGYFTSAGGNPAYDIVSWDGSNWSALPGIPVDTEGIYCLAVYNGNLYAGGYFNTIGNVKVNNIAQWNGTSWTPLGSGVNGVVYSIQAYNGNLYVGGTFSVAGGIAVNNFAEWDGVKWHYAPGFTGSQCYGCQPTFVNSMAIYNGYMFAGGNFDSAGGVPTIDIAGNYGGGTGINNLSAHNDIKIYPNPSNGQFTLQSSVNSGQLTVEVYNTLGQQVYFNSYQPIANGYQLPLSNQPAGVYLYRVISASGNLLGEGKIVIEK